MIGKPEGIEGGEYCELSCGEVEEKRNVKDGQQEKRRSVEKIGHTNNFADE